MARKVLLLTFYTLLCISLSFTGCSRDAEKVSLKEVETIAESTTDNTGMKIVVSAIISPKKTLIYYREVLDYIANELGTDVELIQRETYAEANDLVRSNEVTAAFVCSGAYIDGHKEFGMELLLAPKAYGNPFYYSYIIVPADSASKKLEDLRGKRFAFTDPMSNSGKLSPTYILAGMGETPQSFFSSVTFTYSHDKSIEAVAQNLVDGAAVDSLIWDYASVTEPEFTSKTRVIHKSPPYGIPPVVVPKGLDPEIKNRLRDVLINMHKDDKGKRILEKIRIDRFIEIEDSAYDSIREMRRLVNE
jgi:phosphonate transport system substrate-binding protein